MGQPDRCVARRAARDGPPAPRQRQRRRPRPVRRARSHRGRRVQCCVDLPRALAALAEPPPIDRVVVCHGDTCAPNTLLDDAGRFAGHVDLGALGVADRWADLAIATWSTRWNYGPGWERALLDAYGIAPDDDRTRYYRLLWDLGPCGLWSRQRELPRRSARLAMMSHEMLRKLRRQAARVARSSADADDLVQDALLAALEQQRDWDEHRFLAWASGVMRRRALFLARTAGRRHRRDTSYAVDMAAPPVPRDRLPSAFIDALPPSLRTIALLANAGLGRFEIVHLLGIADTALRKRISDLRRAWTASGADAARDGVSERPLGGLVRRSLRTTLLEVHDARFAMTDPDGHQILIGFAHRSPSDGN